MPLFVFINIGMTLKGVHVALPLQGYIQYHIIMDRSSRPDSVIIIALSPAGHSHVFNVIHIR